MRTSITLADLTMESGEVDVVDDNQVAIVDDIPSPIHSKEFDDMMLVFETHEIITTRKYICRSDMENVKRLAETYPTLGKLIDRYPINSFTQEPSRVNYDVSTESFVKTAYEAVVSALGDLLKYVLEAIGRLWTWLSQASQQTAAIDDLEAKLPSLQKYIIEVDKILSNSAISSMARRVRDGALSNEMRNLNGKWNALKDRQFNDPEKQLSDMTILSGVIRIKLPPFTDAVESFLTSLTVAQTESDVDLAITKLELFDMNSSALVQLANGYGYTSKNVNVNKKLTAFESIAGFMKGIYKGLKNDRISINEDDFKAAMINYSTSKWANEINETISWARGRTDPVLVKVKAFNNAGLKPGLEQVYTQKLVPFMKALASVLTGFTSISEAMGHLTDTRNQVSHGLCNATLGVVKKIDAFALDNKSKLTLIENAAIAAYRRDVDSVVRG